jgi:hypothetical protein
MATHVVRAVAGLRYELRAAQAVVDATRAMAIEANAKVRAELLDALAWDDDGRTPLVDYVDALRAERDVARAS